jgi:hypothetical protein
MSGFPLYDNLIKDISKKDLTVHEKEEFIVMLQRINKSGQELLFALITVYYLQNEDKLTLLHPPYKGNKETQPSGLVNISWNFNYFPSSLKHLLNNFVQMHLKQQEEEEERASSTTMVQALA